MKHPMSAKSMGGEIGRSSPSQENQQQKIGLALPVWWLVFGVATVALSWTFQTFKAFTLTPVLPAGLGLLGALLLVLVSSLVLIYDGYAKDKAAGKVLKPFAPFERIFNAQYGDRFQPTTDVHPNPSSDGGLLNA